MSEKITLRITTETEDGNDIMAPDGTLVCSIGRDEDSFTAAIRVFQSLGFNVVAAEDGSDLGEW